MIAPLPIPDGCIAYDVVNGNDIESTRNMLIEFKSNLEEQLALNIWVQEEIIRLQVEYCFIQEDQLDWQAKDVHAMATVEYIKTTLEGSSGIMNFLRNCETTTGMYTGAATDEAYQDWLGPYVVNNMGEFMTALDNGLMIVNGDPNNLDPRVQFESFCSKNDPAFSVVKVAIIEQEARYTEALGDYDRALTWDAFITDRLAACCFVTWNNLVMEYKALNHDVIAGHVSQTEQLNFNVEKTELSKLNEEDPNTAAYNAAIAGDLGLYAGTKFTEFLADTQWHTDLLAAAGDGVTSIFTQAKKDLAVTYADAIMATDPGPSTMSCPALFGPDQDINEDHQTVSEINALVQGLRTRIPLGQGPSAYYCWLQQDTKEICNAFGDSVNALLADHTTRLMASTTSITSDIETRMWNDLTPALQTASGFTLQTAIDFVRDTIYPREQAANRVMRDETGYNNDIDIFDQPEIDNLGNQCGADWLVTYGGSLMQLAIDQEACILGQTEWTWLQSQQNLLRLPVPTQAECVYTHGCLYRDFNTLCKVKFDYGLAQLVDTAPQVANIIWVSDTASNTPLFTDPVLDAATGEWSTTVSSVGDTTPSVGMDINIAYQATILGPHTGATVTSAEEGPVTIMQGDLSPIFTTSLQQAEANYEVEPQLAIQIFDPMDLLTPDYSFHQLSQICFENMGPANTMSGIQMTFLDGTATTGGFRASQTFGLPRCFNIDVATACAAFTTRPFITAVQMKWWEGKVAGIKFFCEDNMTVVFDTQDALITDTFNTAGVVFDPLGQIPATNMNYPVEDAIKLIEGGAPGDTLMGFEARREGLDALYGFEFVSGTAERQGGFFTGRLMHASRQGVSRDSWPDEQEIQDVFNNPSFSASCFTPLNGINFGNDGLSPGINNFQTIDMDLNFGTFHTSPAYNMATDAVNTRFLGLMQTSDQIVFSWESYVDSSDRLGSVQVTLDDMGNEILMGYWPAPRTPTSSNAGFTQHMQELNNAMTDPKYEIIGFSANSLGSTYMTDLQWIVLLRPEP